MAKPTIQSVRKKSDTLQRQFEQTYGGQPRHTCPLEPLERIIEKARVLYRKSQKVKGGRDKDGNDLGEELRGLTKKRLKHYLEERKAIGLAQSLSPETLEVGALAETAGRIGRAYNRLFAGHNRLTRDEALLDTWIDTLERTHQRLKDLAKDTENVDAEAGVDQRLDEVRMQLERFKSERREIDEAWKDLDPDQRANTLAARANERFAVVQHQLEGKPLLAIRPAFAARVIGGVERILSDMKALEPSKLKDLERHQKNEAAVEARIASLRELLPKLEAAHEAASLEDVANQASYSANVMMQNYREQYAGKPRNEVSAPLLSAICDNLLEALTQLDETTARMGSGTSHDGFVRNAGVIRQVLTTYEAEFGHIVKAQSDDRMARAAASAKAVSQQAPSGDPLAGLLRVKDKG